MCATSGEVMAVLDEVVAHRADWTQFLMDIGTGLTALGGSWENCCLANINHLETPIDYTVTTIDASGAPTTVTKSVPVAGVGFAAACANTAAYSSAQANWATQYNKWLTLQEEWQNNQQAISILATVANLVQLCTALECRNDMYDTAKDKMDTIVGLCDSAIGKVDGGAIETAYCTHVALYPGQSTHQATHTALNAYAGWQTTLYNLWNNPGAGGGLAYADIQSDHIDNMATHLAQLCTNARDISNDIKTLMQFLDNSWNAGGEFAGYESCLLSGPAGAGAVALGDKLCEAATFVDTCQDQMKMCGDTLAACFATDDGNGGLFVNTIKPVISDLISNMNAMNGVIDTLDGCVADAKACLTDLKDNYKAVIDPVEAPGGGVEQILDNATCLFGDQGTWQGTTFFKDCIGFLQTCAEDKKDIFDRYLGTLTANGSSGEYCLGRVIIDQACGLVKNLNDAVQFLGQHKEDCIAIFEGTYEVKENALSLALLNAACDVSNCFLALKTYLETHSDDMDACYADWYQDGEKLWAESMFAEAQSLIDTHSDSFDFLCACADEAKDCWFTEYQPLEKAHMDVLLNEAIVLADTHTDSYDFMNQNAIDAKDCWFTEYQPLEKAHMATLLAEATLLADTHFETFQFLCDCAEAAKACWTDDYAPKEKQLTQAIMQEGCDLAPCVSLAHDWLCDCADYLKDRYKDFWEPKEDAYVCALLDKSIELACDSYDCISEWCNLLDEQYLDWWKCYEDAEKLIAPKIILAGDDACDKQLQMYQETCDRSEHLWGKFDDEWCPCDIDDLQKHCNIWNKANFLEEICNNNMCIQGLGETLKRCYEELVLPCEKEYIEEVCAMTKYQAKYCERGSRAVLHTRKQYDMQADELERCITPYCKGAFVDRVSDLRDEQIKAEQLSIQLADRWEWLVETQECDRRHRYRMEIFELGEIYARNSAAFYEQSTRGNDLILQRIHERISRGYQYMNGAFNQSQQTLNSAAQAVDASLRSIDLGHFWPQWWNDGRDRYLNHSNNRLMRSHEILQIGQRHLENSFSNKQAAAQIAQNAIDDGIQTIDRGHNLLRTAIDSKVQANNVAAQAQDDAHRTIDQGHNLLNHSLQAQTAANNVAAQAQDDAHRTIDQGHNLLRTSLDAKVQANQIAAQVADDALQTIDKGHYFIDASHRDRQLQQRNAVDASQLGQRAIDHGHDHKKMALDAATSEWQGAHAGVQDGLASIDRGHWWLENAREDKRVAMDAYNDVWRNFQGQLQVAHQQMELALAWDRAATEKLQEQKDCGFKAMDYALNTFNAAQRKQETALSAGVTQMNQAIDFLRAGYQRMQIQMNGMTNTQSQIRQSTDGIINMAHEGNQTFLMGAQNTALNEVRIRKECEAMACDIIRGAYNDFARVGTNAGCCVLGPVLGSAANLDNEVANYGAGVFSGLQGAIGPPPQPNFGQFMNQPMPTVTNVTPISTNLGTGTNNTPF